jgi:hypothetical protein
MHGRVYRIEEDKETATKLCVVAACFLMGSKTVDSTCFFTRVRNRSVFVSFGGLLMRLKCETRNLSVTQDADLYLLIRKV